MLFVLSIIKRVNIIRVQKLRKIMNGTSHASWHWYFIIHTNCQLSWVSMRNTRHEKKQTIINKLNSMFTDENSIIVIIFQDSYGILIIFYVFSIFLYVRASIVINNLTLTFIYQKLWQLEYKCLKIIIIIKLN